MSNYLSWRYRRMRSLLQRVRTSIALRGWRGTLVRISSSLEKRPTEDDSLQLLPLDSTFGPLTLPTSASPAVSIIIPVYGKIEYTLACLHSIRHAPPGVPFEVIVVDDASPDNTATVLAAAAGLRLLRNEQNLGFVGSCNAGAAAARGSVLIFLNNDTQVTSGWADALLRAFERFPDTGIAGSQLVYPDGRLQEAGAWVFADASAWNIGRFENRRSPAFRYTRTVDYVSGASLAIPVELFRRVGGFDHRFAPGYYEDTDLAFTVRDAGLQVRYVPDSVVIHAEGISSAGTQASGMKRFQAINQRTFAEKWKKELERQPAAGTALADVNASRQRGMILVSDIAMPDASRDSGSLRLISLMRLLVTDGWHVVFAPDDGHASDEAIRELGSHGIEVAVAPATLSIPAWLAVYGSQLHAAILCRHTVAMQYAPFVRRHAPQARLIFDTVDLHFLREERAAKQAGSAAIARQAEVTRKQELDLIATVDTTFVVSEYERELLSRLLPSAHVAMLSNIHEVHGRRHGFEGRRDLLFVGGHGHPPNADAMEWMASAILPALRSRDPSIQIHVAGDVPADIRQSLSERGLTMHGRVPDLGPLMDTCLASMAPLRFGAGVKGKINMSMSHGLPVIGTPIAVEGMHLNDGIDVLVADTPEAMADATLRLATDAGLWMGLSDRSLEHVTAHFSWQAASEALRAALTG